MSTDMSIPLLAAAAIARRTTLQYYDLRGLGAPPPEQQDEGEEDGEDEDEEGVELGHPRLEGGGRGDERRRRPADDATGKGPEPWPVEKVSSAWSA